MLGHLRPGEKPANNPLRRLAGTEVHTVNVACHFLQEVFCGFDFRHRCLQGKVKKVTGSIAHNLLNKTLQLLAINKTERTEIGIDAATSGIDIRQRHGNQLNIFDLSTGIQGAAVSIAGSLPLPDARLCGIGGEAQLVKELIHVAVHIR